MRILIIGAGGHGKVVADILLSSSNHKIIGFIDDDPNKVGTRIMGIPVLGDTKSLYKIVDRYDIEGAIPAIGDNVVRAKMYELILSIGLKPINAIHKTAHISRTVKMGNAVCIAPGVIINTDVKVGNNVIINTGATVDHDSIVEDHVHIGPGVHLAGNVHVKKYATVYTGAVVIPGITIGENSIIGAGAVVIDDIPDNVVAVGVPAKVIRKLK